MTVRSFIKKALLLAIGLAIIFAVYYVKQALPILSGYGAKNLCSCVFVGKREVDHVIANELASFPLSLGKFTIDLTDSSAYGSVLGLSTRKAIYRKGLGCTLISQIDEAELRLQKVALPEKPRINQDTIPWPFGNLLNDSFPSWRITSRRNSRISILPSIERTVGCRNHFTLTKGLIVGMSND